MSVFLSLFVGAVIVSAYTMSRRDSIRPAFAIVISQAVWARVYEFIVAVWLVFLANVAALLITIGVRLTPVTFHVVHIVLCHEHGWIIMVSL